jgi:hypothetical protein
VDEKRLHGERYFARLSKTLLATGKAEKALGQPA